MIFRRISYRIALQFTAFVFVLLLTNGVAFLAADFRNAREQARFRLDRLTHSVVTQLQEGMDGMSPNLEPIVKDRIRIVDASGKSIYSGILYETVPFSFAKPFSEIVVQNDEYLVQTSPIMQGSQLIGYIQVADLNRQQRNDLPYRAFLYVIVSLVISLLTYVVGLFFARSSLRPAEQMMQRLEQFTQDASHELRTPLAALSSSLDLALKTKKYQEGIVSAKEDLQEASVLLERLLELARLDKFIIDEKLVDLSQLVETSIEKHTILADERHLVLEKYIQPGVMVKADAALVKQILSNLIYNAMKFSKPSGGTIVVRLKKNALSIEDQGIGIHPDALPHIFDRFYQVEESRSGDGFGLGLALVKRIVDLHGWTISVQSMKDKGTTFTIHFTKAA